MNFGKGKSDILFSLICIWAIIFFSAAFTAIGAAASHSEWVLTHAETEQESVAAESGDEAVEANGDIEIRAEKGGRCGCKRHSRDNFRFGRCRYFGCRDSFRFAQAQHKKSSGRADFRGNHGGNLCFFTKM